jgi:molybdopterin molybdotransferase
MLASVGQTRPIVYRRPKAAIITSGDELVDAAAQPGPGQIRNGNQYSLLGEALDAGAEVSLLEHVGDQKEEIERALSSAVAASDLVIVCGGVSVGEYDYVKDILAKLGKMLFWRVAIKPGMPLAFGRIDGKPVFGLPGNPVSCMVNFDLFVRPAILRMMGAEDVSQRAVTATVTEDIRHKPGRREFVRAVTVWKDDAYSARPIPKHGSGMLSSMVEANSYVVVPEETGDITRGDRLEIILF